VVSAPKPKPRPTPKPTFEIAAQSVSEGQEVAGLVIWRIDVNGTASRVEFWIDGSLRGTDLRRPFTLGWDTTSETPGLHKVEARAFGAGRRATAPVTVTVAPR
jgi:Bacterial Ig domain